MSTRALFALIAIASLVAGGGLWISQRKPAVSLPRASAPNIAPAALYAATFTDSTGQPRSLGQFQGKIVVANFWATWCGPCREEMPAFSRLDQRWADRGVQFVGLSSEEREKVERFGRETGVRYPLWVGGSEVGELSRRLGNNLGVLPHTAILGPAGSVLASKVGPYTEAELDAKLAALVVNTR